MKEISTIMLLITAMLTIFVPLLDYARGDRSLRNLARMLAFSSIGQILLAVAK